MHEAFAKARARAESIRYGGDLAGPQPVSVDTIDHAKIWGRLDQAGLEVSAALLPTVEATLKDCHSTLGLPREAVRTYVYASSELQASCLPIGANSCAVRLSSSLVERLEPGELAFVVGHEYAHYLLQHSSLEFAGVDSLEAYSISRAREVSCDRLGLIACGSIEYAIKAIFKTVSGLGPDHIRFDVAEFLRSGLRNIPRTHDPSTAYATHPPLHVRARMLLWFSQYLGDCGVDFDINSTPIEFEKMEQRVARDMELYVEHTSIAMQEGLKKEAARWIWLAAAVSDGKLSSEEQEELRSRFGAEFVEKALRNLRGMSSREVRTFVAERAEKEIAEYRRAFPLSSGSFVAAEMETCNQLFGTQAPDSLIFKART